MSTPVSRPNASAATLTKNRTEDSVVPSSGMCVTCVDGCIGMCEIGKSAYRGHEVIYPQPFGVITTAAEKRYPVDYSHFNIMGTAVGAHGIEADSDKAIFPAVNLEVALGDHEGKDKGIRFRLPWLISGIGSTNIARDNWEGLAIGSALAGTGLTIGENVVAMDPEAVIENGRVVDTVDLKRRVKLYTDHQRDGYGAIIVQANVEDTMLGVLGTGQSILYATDFHRWAQQGQEWAGNAEERSVRSDDRADIYIGRDLERLMREEESFELAQESMEFLRQRMVWEEERFEVWESDN